MTAVDVLAKECSAFLFFILFFLLFSIYWILHNHKWPPLFCIDSIKNTELLYV